MKKGVATKYLITLLIILIAVLIILLIFSFRAEKEHAIDKKEYIIEEIIEPEEIVPEETEEIPIIEESEIETEVMDKVIITINNLRFYPNKVTISPGTTIIWVNNDTTAHKIVAYDRLFYSPRLNPGEKYGFTFTQKGTHRYFDAVFPKIGRGDIIVKEEPLPLTGGVIGVDLIEEENNAKFALVFILFIVMIFGLSHGIYKHHNE